MGGSYARSRPTPMTLHREPEPTFEEAEEALSEGDAIFRTRRPGTVLSALAHVAFRRMWIGSFASNIGTWMQTLVLGAYAYELTGSSAFVGAAHLRPARARCCSSGCSAGSSPTCSTAGCS